MDQLPVRFNPAELARYRRTAQITLPVSHFSRLAAILADDSGSVSVEVTFGFTEDRLPVANGSQTSRVKMTCQRCQQAMQVELTGSFSLVFVASEEAAAELPESLDPVILGRQQTDENQPAEGKAGNDEIHVVEFLEDELILHLPTRVVHKNEQECDPAVIAALSGNEHTPTDTHNPFAGLDDLLKK